MKRKWYYLWAAIDIHTREILAVHLTSSRSSLDTLIFLKKVLKSCTNKPKVYVVGSPSYPWALQRLSMLGEHMTFGKRNAI
ncbi:MAG: IS6 family transposase [Euryarchaeota archaeon]|nr:IS6 family transposase [Euryarchaeota archaeon]